MLDEILNISWMMNSDGNNHSNEEGNGQPLGGPSSPIITENSFQVVSNTDIEPLRVNTSIERNSETPGSVSRISKIRKIAKIFDFSRVRVSFDCNFAFAGSPKLFSGRGMFVGHICN